MSHLAKITVLIGLIVLCFSSESARSSEAYEPDSKLTYEFDCYDVTGKITLENIASKTTRSPLGERYISEFTLKDKNDDILTVEFENMIDNVSDLEEFNDLFLYVQSLRIDCEPDLQNTKSFRLRIIGTPSNQFEEAFRLLGNGRLLMLFIFSRSENADSFYWGGWGVSAAFKPIGVGPIGGRRMDGLTDSESSD